MASADHADASLAEMATMAPPFAPPTNGGAGATSASRTEPSSVGDPLLATLPSLAPPAPQPVEVDEPTYDDPLVDDGDFDDDEWFDDSASDEIAGTNGHHDVDIPPAESSVVVEHPSGNGTGGTMAPAAPTARGTDDLDVDEWATQVGMPATAPATAMLEAVAPPPPPSAPLTPVPRPSVRQRGRPRVRKVTRIVRYVDPWSVFKIALLVNLILAVIFVTASVLLWNLAYNADVVDNIEGVIADLFAYEEFTFVGDELFRAVLVLAGVLVVAGTGLAVLVAVVFNLISDLTGGIKFTVLEREVVAAEDMGLARRTSRRG